MTFSELMKYDSILKEITQLEKLIEDGMPKFIDKVQSAATFPYRNHEISITGNDTGLYNSWKRQLEDDKIQLDRIKRFIESCEDKTAKAILRYKVYDGLSWQCIALRLNYQDRKTPKRIIDKYLKHGTSWYTKVC